MHKYKSLLAFTIVELLIVIVVIGILATITIVSFGGIAGQANQASLKSDLDANSRKLQLYFTQYGSYPTTFDGSNCPTAPVADTNYCLKISSGNSITYQIDSSNLSDYALYATRGTTIFKVSSTAPPTATKLTAPCPTGFIVVPGSTTYGTSDFCVMKYEAKCASMSALSAGLTTSPGNYYDSDLACTSANSRAVVSLASGFPIMNMNQVTASSRASTTSGCTGCKLMTEAEWLTIAQNVLSNPVNWSGNIVGSGYLYSGHNSSNYVNGTLDASSDTNGYYKTGNTSGNTKRTLTLTNGEIIWDFSGNAWEWTAGQTTGGQPTGSPYALREWTAVSGGTISPSPFPSTTGLSGANTWNSSNGIGQVYSDSADSTQRGFMRGGGFAFSYSSSSAVSGVLALRLDIAPSTNLLSGCCYEVGFRSTR